MELHLTLVSCPSHTVVYHIFDILVPEVFASLLDLDSVGWKQKKFTLKEFSDAMGCEPQGSARYHTLYITSDINIKWNPSTGEFKFSGTYGRPV